MLVSKTESATNAHKDFLQILDDVAQDGAVVIVERDGAPNAAIIAESELNSLIETVHLLKSPENARRLFGAIERSQQRDLDTLQSEETHSEKVLTDLRQYCEQEKSPRYVGR